MKRRYRVLISVSLLVITIVVSILFEGELKYVFSSTFNEGPIYRVNKDEKVISLSFDINWAEKDEIYNILEVLDKYNVKATFFIMGGWVNYSEENREKLIKIKEGGHEIGNHSYIHPMFTKIDENRMKEELEKQIK
ncbi:putative xylanase/chitin deacetylase [Clostridium sartagoforme AAU1]|uniref:Putative xylanase/chitin deacetylase n=1 Tax=Clostridium sartagoforme AAU1 TaxID=1202534 RepID=R9CC73_9CLOT|nr:putative xylanase/chitin deacetylase [Clostridium sartagoforme AAU1]